MKEFKYYLEKNYIPAVGSYEHPDNLIIDLGYEEDGWEMTYLVDYNAVDGVHHGYLDPEEDKVIEITYTRFKEIAGEKLALIPKEYLPEYPLRFMLRYEGCENGDKATQGIILLGENPKDGTITFCLGSNGMTYTIYTDEVDGYEQGEYVEVTLEQYKKFLGDKFKYPTEKDLTFYYDGYYTLQKGERGY